MYWEAVQKALVEWCNTQLIKTFPTKSIKVIWLYPNSPRPSTKPYVTLNIQSYKKQCMDFYGEVSDSGIATRYSILSAILNIACYQSQPGYYNESFDIIAALNVSLGLQDVRSYFKKNNMGLMDYNNPILLLPENVATGFEARANTEITIQLLYGIDNNVGWIEHINGEGKIDNAGQELIENFNV